MYLCTTREGPLHKGIANKCGNAATKSYCCANRPPPFSGYDHPTETRPAMHVTQPRKQQLKLLKEVVRSRYPSTLSHPFLALSPRHALCSEQQVLLKIHTQKVGHAVECGAGDLQWPASISECAPFEKSDERHMQAHRYTLSPLPPKHIQAARNKAVTLPKVVG